MDINILSTSPLYQPLIDKLAVNNIAVDVSSMIETVPVESEALDKLLSELIAQPATVVFTSVNAVTNVTKAIKGEKPDWHIFCTSKATADAVTAFFGVACITATADNASKLADKIIKAKTKNVVFFCGNKPRYELPDKLIKARIGVQKVTVYNTFTTSIKVSKFYDGILFFSPSGVDSFLAENEFDEDTVLFAIGTTTGYALKDVTRNRIIVSNTPAKDNMIDLVIDFFNDEEEEDEDQ
jgi:uroporphyrinogen-III synthase